MRITALVAWLRAAGGRFNLLAKRIAAGSHRAPSSTRFLPAMIFWQLLLASVVLFLWIVYLVTGDHQIGWVALSVLALVALLGFVVLGQWIPMYRHSRATLAAGDEQLGAPADGGRPKQAFLVRIVSAAQAVLVIATLTLVIAAGIGTPKIDTFKDSFKGGISAHWFKEGQTKPMAQNGAVVINHAATRGYNALRSVNRYDLTGSSAYVQVRDFGNQSLPSHDVYFTLFNDSSNSVAMLATGSTLSARMTVAGVKTKIGPSIPLDPVAHRWWRIREASGTTYFDTSPDSVTWTNHWSVADPINLTSLNIILQSGGSKTESEGSRAIFANLNTSAPGNNPPNPKMGTFKDSFKAGISAHWFKEGQTKPMAQNGAVVINHAATREYNALRSVNRYDLTGSSAYVQVRDFGNQSLPSHDVYFTLFNDSSNSVAMLATGSTLSARMTVAGVKTKIGPSIPLDPVAHRWWRIREASGTTYFDTSPDSVTWTNHWSVADPINLTSLNIILQSGGSKTESEGSRAIFANLNTSAPSK